MLVWLEGADGSGKTSLLNTLKEYGYNSIQSPPRLDCKTAEYDAMKALCDKGRTTNKTVLVDRGPMTEFVYRIVDQEDSYIMSVESYIDLIKGSKVIYCYNKNAFANAMKRGEDNIVDVAVHRQIVNTYEHHLYMLKQFCKDMGFMWYNWEVHNIIDALKFINN